MYNEFIYKTFSKIFKSSNQQELDNVQELVVAINDKENEIKTLNESDRGKTAILKECSKWFV